jgi:rhomboid protease GluP
VTPVLLAVLVLIFIPMALSPRINELFTEWGANRNLLVTEGQWWRLITATFLHAGIIHILLNGYALFVIGMELEGLMGRARFAAVYAISALAGSVASYAFSPALVSSVGASGAIFGLVGALGVYFGLHRKLFGRMGNAQFWNIILVILINVGIGFSGIFPIDNSAHIGGLLAGAAVGYALCPRYTLGEWYNPLARSVRNVNTGPLPWIAAGLIGLVVVFAFLTLFLMFRTGTLTPRLFP